MALVEMQLIYAMVVAIVFGMAKYFENSNLEQFHWPMFTKTVIIGGAVGVAQFYMGLTYEDAWIWVSTNAFIMKLIDELVNAIFRLKPEPKYDGVPI